MRISTAGRIPCARLFSFTQRQIEAARLQTRREETLRTDALKKTELATKAQLERLRIQTTLATGSTSGLRQGLRR